MKRMARVVAVLAALMATIAKGQIGDSPAGCSNQWGASLSGQIDPKGEGTLNFATGEVAVEVDFVAGVVQRVVYRAPTLDNRTVQGFLDANRHGAEWQIFRRPSRGKVDTSRQTWMRSDEMGSAELSAGMLTITGHSWYRHLAEAAALGSTQNAAANSELIAREAKNRLFVGYWQSSGTGATTVVLHVLDTGILSWVVSDEADRRSMEMQWACNTTEQQTLYTLTQASTNMGSGLPVRTFGQLELVSTNLLRWRAETNAEETKSRLLLGALKTGALFDRIAEMPHWTPSTLPAKGTSRQEVVRLLGNPTGTVSLGGCEILVYPWGKVWIAKGVVRSIE